MNALHPITTSRTVLRLAEVADASRLLRYREQNREHLAPWEPLRDEAYYTLDHCVQTLAESREAMRLDRAYPFYALDLSGRKSWQPSLSPTWCAVHSRPAISATALRCVGKGRG